MHLLFYVKLKTNKIGTGKINEIINASNIIIIRIINKCINLFIFIKCII